MIPQCGPEATEITPTSLPTFMQLRAKLNYVAHFFKGGESSKDSVAAAGGGGGGGGGGRSVLIMKNPEETGNQHMVLKQLLARHSMAKGGVSGGGAIGGGVTDGGARKTKANASRKERGEEGGVGEVAKFAHIQRNPVHVFNSLVKMVLHFVIPSRMSIAPSSNGYGKERDGERKIERHEKKEIQRDRVRRGWRVCVHIYPDETPSSTFLFYVRSSRVYYFPSFPYHFPIISLPGTTFSSAPCFKHRPTSLDAVSP